MTQDYSEDDIKHMLDVEIGMALKDPKYRHLCPTDIIRMVLDEYVKRGLIARHLNEMD